MDWDDDEESTHVYDKQTQQDGNLKRVTPLGTSSSSLPKAAATLVASSGGAAAPATKLRTPVPTPPPIPSAPPPPPIPGPPPMPDRTIIAASRNDEPTAIRPRVALPQGGTSKTGVILGGLALVAVLVLAVMLLVPKDGGLKIDLKTAAGAEVARAEIFIDGQKRCDAVPCIVRDLEPGAKAIKVLAPDFPPHDATEVVEGGKDKVVVIVIGTAADAQASTGFKASGAQPGVKVLVDGVEKGTLPVELSVPPGTHKVRFDGGERYESREQEVEIGQGQMKDLGDVRLKVLKGQVTLDLATSGASVKLVNAKGVETKVRDSELKNPPVKLDVDPSEGWKLVVSKRGHETFSQELSFEDGQAEKTIRVELTESSRRGGAIAVPAPAPAPAPPAPAPEPAGDAPSGASTEAAAVGQGTLNINSIPVSKVVLDGRPLGSTPKVGISVTPGSHTVLFVHPELGKKTVTVTVKAGETKTAAVRFEEQ